MPKTNSFAQYKLLSDTLSRSQHLISEQDFEELTKLALEEKFNLRDMSLLIDFALALADSTWEHEKERAYVIKSMSQIMQRYGYQMTSKYAITLKP